jgi:hypothetical protein
MVVTLQTIEFARGLNVKIPAEGVFPRNSLFFSLLAGKSA